MLIGQEELIVGSQKLNRNDDRVSRFHCRNFVVKLL